MGKIRKIQILVFSRINVYMIFLQPNISQMPFCIQKQKQEQTNHWVLAQVQLILSFNLLKHKIDKHVDDEKDDCCLVILDNLCSI